VIKSVPSILHFVVFLLFVQLQDPLKVTFYVKNVFFSIFTEFFFIRVGRFEDIHVREVSRMS